MVGGALERGGKEGQDRLLTRNQPTVFFFEKNRIPRTNPSKKHFFGPCTEVFLVWDLDRKTRVLHCSTRQGGGGGE